MKRLGDNNEILVSSTNMDYPSNFIVFFSRTANGIPIPLRTMSGSSTGLKQPAGIALATK